MMKDRANPRLRRILCLACGAVIVVCMALALLWPAANRSVQALCNCLFDLSESRNAYIYTHFPVPDGTGVQLAAWLLAICAAAVTGLTFAVRGGLLPLLLAAGLALFQAYFGVCLPTPLLAAGFGVPALAIMIKRSGGKAAAVSFVLAAALFLLALALFPSPSVQVEQASEAVRDRLTLSLDRSADAGEGEAPEAQLTRHENQRDLLPGSGEAQTEQEYRLVTVEEQQIALPHWVDLMRIILLCLLIPAVLVVPFAPFVWLNSRRRRTEANRACLASPDDREAVTGMFRLVIGYLDACAVGDPNALYTRRLEGTQLPPDYAGCYLACARIWQAAAYGAQPIRPEDRDAMARLLAQTEQLLYDQADGRTRLRLKYRACLHE